MQVNKTLIVNEHAKLATVIWLHGLGASPYNFTFFGSLFPDIKWILPCASSRFVTIYQQESPAWFDIKSFNRQDDPAITGILKTHKALEEILLMEDSHSIFLGGFSQGAAQSLYSGLNGFEDKIKGIIAMSGYCPFVFKKNSAPPTLIMHGNNDEVIPWQLAKSSYSELMKQSSVSSFLLPCAHEWHPDMEHHMTTFIKNTV